jgi:exopolysaccharide production protein ExoQ
MATETRPSLLRILEVVAAVVVIMMMSNALIGPLLDPKQTGGDQIPILRLLWLPVYAVIAGLTLLRLPDIGRYWAPALGLLLLIAWTFASVTWSIAPDITMRRAVAVAITTLFGLYLAASFGGRGLSEVLAFSFLILALGSYVVSLAFPSIGVHSGVNGGLWRGLWYEKNQMGAMMVYGAIAALAAAITSPRRRGLWIFTLVLCAGLIVMTRSTTSLLSLGIILSGAGVLGLMGLGPAAAVAAVWFSVTGAMVLGGIYTLAPDLLFHAVGKDPSLTGRTQIWQAVLRDSREAPLTGYGYAAFWDRQSAPAKWIRSKLEWVVPNAHNGWLDLLIQLGQIGVALFAALFGAALLAALFRHRRVRDGYWSTLFLAVFFIELLSESFILNQNSLQWVLAVAAMARMLGPMPGAATPAAPRTTPARSFQEARPAPA